MVLMCGSLQQRQTMSNLPPLGVYPVDSVKDVAESLSIDSLGAGAAEALAGDVEYRIHLILQEAKKFMVHGRRRTLLPEDVTFAMDALNVEPILQPPRPLAQPSFQALTVPTASGSDSQQIYYLQDDEIDLATYLKTPPVSGKSLKKTAGVKWKAHWLAVEGVQPAIPENPIVKDEVSAPSTSNKPRSTLPVPTTGSASLPSLAKSVLSQELQLYFTRLTTALIPPATPTSQTDRHRIAALASLRSDPGLGALIVYLVKWVSESVTRCLGGTTSNLTALLDVIEALIENDSLFMEPYLHQLLPSLMSILLTVPLGPHPAPNPPQTPATFEVRQRASSILGKLCSSYGRNHEGLIPRITTTLIRALQSPPFPSPLGPTSAPIGRYEGAVLGLGALGVHAVRKGIWGTAGENVLTLGTLIGTLGGNIEGGKGKGVKNLTKATVMALQQLVPPIDKSQPAPHARTDVLTAAFGGALAHAFEKRAALGEALLQLKEEEGGQVESKEVGMEVD